MAIKINQKKSKLSAAIDQTNINPKASIHDIKKTCESAKKHGFRGVCVNPKWVRSVNEELRGTEIKTICLVDAPIGDSPHEKRMQICKSALTDGADEIDVVIPIPLVKHEQWEEVYRDLREICQILPTKVIIGSGYLTDQEIGMASRITKQAGAICVKTATSKDPLEMREIKEKLRHLKIMKKFAPNLLIKASGNIKTAKDAKAAIRAGADIIGTSSGEDIIK